MLEQGIILQKRYRIVRPLGQGGMGTVYEAVDQRLDTTVALKETHFTEERLRKQFEREARLLARLRHPAMTRVIDHFEENDGQFLVMDFVAGEDLWKLLHARGAAFPITDALRWADQLLDALNYLHDQDPPVIHRDIKPQNLKLSESGQVILLDFGLAKGFAGQISRVTSSGSIFGYTPNYAPLEQIQGTGTEPRSDLYSLSATIYHLVTGTCPPDVLTRLTATTEGNADPLIPANTQNPEVSVQFGEFLARGMAIARSQRFGSAREMREYLAPLRVHDRTSMPVVEPLLATSLNAHEEDRQTPQALPPTIASPVLNELDGETGEKASDPDIEATVERKLTDAEALQLEYWTQFSNFLKAESWLSPPKPRPQYWMAFAVGRKGFVLSATLHIRDLKIGVNLTLSGPHAKEHFHILLENIEAIEEEIGSELTWKESPEGKESHIISDWDADPSDRENWPVQFEGLQEELEAFHETFGPRIQQLDLSHYGAAENNENSHEPNDADFEDVAEFKQTVQQTNVSAWLLLGIFVFIITVMVLMAVFKVL